VPPLARSHRVTVGMLVMSLSLTACVDATVTGPLGPVQPTSQIVLNGTTMDLQPLVNVRPSEPMIVTVVYRAKAREMGTAPGCNAQIVPLDLRVAKDDL